jgi:predicted Rossmann fold flavoprotein
VTEERSDILIIGAGAAGLMAGISAGRKLRQSVRRGRIIVIDGAARLGAKILISGGGRCNVTHEVVRAEDFNGSSRPAIRKVLRTFDVPDTVEFFESIGVELKREETGKMFPLTDSARTVLDALVDEAHAAGCEILTRTKALGVVHDGAMFQVTTDNGSFAAPTLVLAAGGKSIPKTGSDGSAFVLAESLGHSVLEPFPALVPLVFPSGHWLTALSGVTLPMTIAVEAKNGRVIERCSGSAVLTHFGISGPAALDISRHWLAARRSDPEVRVVANFTGMQLNELDEELVQAAVERPRAFVSSHFLLAERLVAAVLENAAGVSPQTQLVRMKRDERKRVARAFTSLELSVVADRGFDYAEVTAGGVPLAELHGDSLESRKTPGLFLCGEVLDVDGRIGGFNFQWAWASGRLAGIAAARDLIAHHRD